MESTDDFLFDDENDVVYSKNTFRKSNDVHDNFSNDENEDKNENEYQDEVEDDLSKEYNKSGANDSSSDDDSIGLKRRGENLLALDYFDNIDSPLSKLKDEYTHYDLHPENMLLHRLDENGFIMMQYIDSNNNNEIIQFKTSYVCKIVDYRKSFFAPNKLETENPNSIYENVINRKCVRKRFGNLKGDPWDTSN